MKPKKVDQECLYVPRGILTLDILVFLPLVGRWHRMLKSDVPGRFSVAGKLDLNATSFEIQGLQPLPRRFRVE